MPQSRCPETGATLVQRASPRYEIAADGTLDLPTGNKLRVKLEDISLHGCKVRCSDPVAIGSDAKVRFSGLGGRSAQVIWQLGGRVGARFHEPLTTIAIIRAALKDRLRNIPKDQ